MSAWITSITHVKAIVGWASKNDVAAVRGNERMMAQMLHNENVASVNYRYSEDTAPTAITWDGKFMALRPVEVIKACHCQDYQSCEHDGWDGSAAKALLEKIIDRAVGELPGYDEAPWGIDDPVGVLL